jgi:hypothetical protein
MKRLFSLSLALLLSVQTVVLAESPPLPIDPVMLKKFKARSIGPAVMGGRVSEIAMDPKNPYTFYVALGTGGVMKTEDNGASFSGIFEEESVAGVGAVAERLRALGFESRKSLDGTLDRHFAKCPLVIFTPQRSTLCLSC